MSRKVCTERQYVYSKALTLLPLWTIRPVQSLTACTVQLYLYSPYRPYCLYRASVPVQYSYTSTPPIGLTACTEPQCLYNGALYLFYSFIAFRFPTSNIKTELQFYFSSTVPRFSSTVHLLLTSHYARRILSAMGRKIPSH